MAEAPQERVEIYCLIRHRQVNFPRPAHDADGQTVAAFTNPGGDAELTWKSQRGAWLPQPYPESCSSLPVKPS